MIGEAPGQPGGHNFDFATSHKTLEHPCEADSTTRILENIYSYYCTACMVRWSPGHEKDTQTQARAYLVVDQSTQVNYHALIPEVLLDYAAFCLYCIHYMQRRVP